MKFKESVTHPGVFQHGGLRFGVWRLAFYVLRFAF